MDGRLSKYTTRLFSPPSFLEGMARVLDLGGTFDQYNVSASGEEADRQALESDWNAIGADMYDAIARFQAAHPELRPDAPEA